ncbi:hypothetical protein NIIDMKKI_56270 [Mycobacterium kansasii]|uniref:NADH-Ubiquinone/plastoquinone (Complex I), various chains family protein n=1 Tax=Mycobacterium kansasii TaxID=1768 RepID=A0A7G1IHG0_MYCKA|nr:hypothetical protein NIIDMKKI_56270 [Mycobacterium kansasii]
MVATPAPGFAELAIVTKWRANSRVHAYVALTLAIESMVLISLVALDVLLFYVFFEAMLIPMYFLIGGFGQGPGARAPR